MYQDYLKTCGHCKRSDRLAGLASYIKGTAKPEPKTKGASDLSLVRLAVGEKYHPVEHKVKLEELGKLVKGL
jgi:hypothetical protein